MGYRTEERPRPPQRRSMQDTATPSRVFVHNGCTADLAIPCWYQEVHPPINVRPHDKPWHDHVGWPTPDHPDRICQLWEIEHPGGHGCHEMYTHPGFRHPHDVRKLVDMRSVHPIHLLEEGYKDAFVEFIDEHEGIVATAQIDEKEDWTVRVFFDVLDPNALDKPRNYRFTVFVTDGTRRDIVCLSVLTVLPSAYLGLEEGESE